jgi:tetratricopeptide (TPR) repeat protein
VVVPSGFLILVEILLRLTGYGYPTTFFVKTDDGQHWITNRKFGWRFLPRETAPLPYPILIPVQKAPGAVRIFILGESAAQGTPAPAFGFARILDVMLHQQFPERRFEIINAAMRGINSHVVLPIARDCAAHEPDLFIVYMGNNEAIGLHAPDSTAVNFTPYLRLLRAGQWIKATRLAQLMDGLIRAIGKRPARRPEQDMPFFRSKRLAYDDARRQAVYDNFRANLADICQTTRASGAKVIVATVVVNLRDFPPLASLHRTDRAPPALGQWESIYAQGINAEARGLFAEALAHYQEAERLDDHFAELHFRLARCALAMGRLDEARSHFALARDWDALPFRTDSKLNRIIRETVAAHKESELSFADTERAFADESSGEGGVPGRRLFHEHVHLNFDGDYLLARTFLPIVAEALHLAEGQSQPTLASRSVPTRQECAEALAFTEWDDISVTAAMLRQTARPPFLDQLEHAEAQGRAEQALADRSRVFERQAGLARAVETYRTATAQRLDDWQLHQNFGTLLSDFSDARGAAAEYSAAARLMPDFPPLRIMLGDAFWGLGQRAEAIQQFQEALRIDPSFAPARDALNRATRH